MNSLSFQAQVEDMTEAELAKYIVVWLQNMRWDVYQEVQMVYGGPIADIVAAFGKITWVIETKRQFGLSVLRQADNWIHDASFVSIGIELKRNNSWTDRFSQKIMNYLGVGLISVSTGDFYAGEKGTVKEVYKPRLNRHPSKLLLNSLVEQQKTFAPAGNADGLRWTPFQETSRKLQQYVKEHPGATLKEIINSIQTHYASPQTARVCIAKWVKEGVIKGIKYERDGRTLRFYEEEIDCGSG
jgi:hypothetical protein